MGLLMFSDLNAAERELLARALDTFVGDVDAGVIPGVTLEQAQQLRAAILPELPTARHDGRVLACAHEGCLSSITLLREDGYLRDWSLHAGRDGFTAVDNGLEAYSENGSEEFLGICALGHSNYIPDSVFQLINWN